MYPQIGVVIPTFQAAKHLPHCLPPLLQSPLKPRVLVLDSSSSDGTAEIAKRMGAEVAVIPQSEFNHGTTREKGRQILRTPIIVMVTQDAYAASPDMLEHLIKPLAENKASVSYARQIPHQGAGFFGSFSRRFNYPEVSHIRSIGDVEKYGVYTFFCSNSCAAYLDAALEEVQGFPQVLFGEDTVVVSKLLNRGHHVAYVAEAIVRHSHDYTVKQEFCRHFDMGFSRRLHQDLLALGGSDSQRGKAYVKTMLTELWRISPAQIPYACLQTLAKYCGYRLGKASMQAPLWFKKSLSSQKSYWKAEAANGSKEKPFT
jgi:rhamnosyltransferase